MSISDAVAKVEENLYHHISWLHQQVGSMIYFDTGEYLLCDSGLPDDTFNKASRLKPGKQAADICVAEIVDHFAANNSPFTIWLTPSTATQSVLESMSNSGLQKVETEVGMILNQQHFRPAFEYSQTTQPSIIPVSSHNSSFEFSQVLASLWEPVNQHVIEYYSLGAPHILAAGSPIQQFIGKLGNDVVGTAEIHLHDGIAGIHNVAVLPQFRRMGMGTKLTQKCIEWSFENNISTVVLLASEMGLPVYEKLGFSPVGLFTEFALQ